jgi:hypothetical protein
MDAEAIADIVEQCLNGDSGYVMKSVGFAITSLSDLGEVYVRTPSGDHFRLTVEPVAADDIEGWGIEFDD